jgi:hypothetical protein
LLKLDGGRTTELYNLSSDPGEQQNVAAEHPNILNRLESALVRARVDSSDWPVKRSAGR